MSALSRALHTPVEVLEKLAETASTLYRPAKPIIKPDGKIRQPFDALPPLKAVHRQIKVALLGNVVFPPYLTGSIKGKSYRVNAKLHAGAKIVICEDVERFFPNTSGTRIYDIWRNFCGHSEPVAGALTQLTTKDGWLPEGAITSSDLANLVFWRSEPSLHAALAARGLIYSRYVDDVTISSKQVLTTRDQSDAIARIYSMLAGKGYLAKRRKHEVFTARRRMFTTKLLVNRRPALTQQERSRIRAAVHQLEQRQRIGERGAAIDKELSRVAGRVSKLRSFHPAEGAALMARVNRIRDAIHAQ